MQAENKKMIATNDKHSNKLRTPEKPRRIVLHRYGARSIVTKRKMHPKYVSIKARHNKVGSRWSYEAM